MPTLQAYLLTKLQQAKIPASQISRVEWYDDIVRGFRIVPLAEFSAAANAVQVASIPEGNRTKLHIVVATPEGDRVVQYDGADFFIDDGENFREPFTASHLTSGV